MSFIMEQQHTVQAHDDVDDDKPKTKTETVSLSLSQNVCVCVSVRSLSQNVTMGSFERAHRWDDHHRCRSQLWFHSMQSHTVWQTTPSSTLTIGSTLRPLWLIIKNKSYTNMSSIILIWMCSETSFIPPKRLININFKHNRWQWCWVGNLLTFSSS